METNLAITNNIGVKVRCTYSSESAIKTNPPYLWLYQVKIVNYRKNLIQLLERNWQIIDSCGMVYKVKGEGVIGKQPILCSEEIFQYSSQVYLYTGSGMMLGTYLICDHGTNERFDVHIPAFSLDIDRLIQYPN